MSRSPKGKATHGGPSPKDVRMKMLRSLIIGEKEKKAIRSVLQYAEKHKVPIEDVKRISEGKMYPVGDKPGYACMIPDGFRVVFCIEEQPAGWCNHLSVAIDEPEALPSVPAVEAIMQEFGMWGTSLDCDGIWVEGRCFVLPDKRVVDAINLLQKIRERKHASTAIL